MRHTMHLQPGVAKQPNLELKTWPKQLLGSLPLVIALPGGASTFKSDYLPHTTVRDNWYKVMDPLSKGSESHTREY